MKISSLLLCFALLAGVFAASAVNICYIFDNFVVDAANANVVPADSEPATLLGGALEFNHTGLPLINTQDFIEWNTSLRQCAVLLLPEMEHGRLLLPTYADRLKVIDLIREWTSAGGLVVSGGSPFNMDFLVEVFGVSYAYGPDLFSDAFELNRTAAGASTRPFSNPTAPVSLLDHDATFGLTQVPSEECMYYGDDATSCVVTFTRYGDANSTSEIAGGVAYFGWDWWNAAPVGTTDGNEWVPLMFRELISVDCNNNQIVDSLEADCNANGIADACEISAATDCNGNGLLDECELSAENDCNNNTVIDSCELAGNDCDNNNELDECQTPAPDCSQESSSEPHQTGPTGADGATNTHEPTNTSGDGDGDQGDGDRSSAAALRTWMF